MRFIDGSSRLIRSPTTEFRSQEIDEDAFGYNIPNRVLLDSLNSALETFDSIERIDARVEAVTLGSDHNLLVLDNGQHVNTRLIAAADGRESPLRQAAGIASRRWAYEQTAVTLTFTHELPHHHVSNEFHTETGPMTQVPLPSVEQDQFRSSLVWVVSPQEADKLVSKPNSVLSLLVETGLHSLFGRLEIEGQVQAYPLSGMIVDRYSANRIALLGEAAHAFPPIGAQGFNLGLRDVGDFVKSVSALHLVSFDTALLDYHARRIMDAKLRTMAVDLLNRSLLTNFLPVQFARASILALTGQSSKLRHALMQQGMGINAMETNPVAKFLSRLGKATPSP